MTENTIHQTLTPAEVRQSFLSEIEVSKQIIAELSDEQLKEIAGGVSESIARGVAKSVQKFDGIHGTYRYLKGQGLSHVESLQHATAFGPAIGAQAARVGKTGAEGVSYHIYRHSPRV